SCLLSLFFVMRRPPLPPTLFPYTTLFRSVDERRDIRARRAVDGDLLERALHELAVHEDLGEQHALFARARRNAEFCQIIVHLFGDRKSTRLNSSHVSISYAVFCLQKKNFS